MNKKFVSNVVFYLLVALIALVVLFPFLWMLSSSFKTQSDITSWPPQLFFFADFSELPVKSSRNRTF